ncbi:MAG: T9SS type A sorting domain-containing protein [Bacteroidia bacterium]
MKRTLLLLRQSLLILIVLMVGGFQSAVYAQTSYVQSSDSLGLLVMQAEDFSVNKDGTGIKAGDLWQFATDSSGFNGSGYMQSVMTAGDGSITNAETVNAKLTYDVEFVYTGTHYLWAYVYFPDGSGDSFFYGLDSSVVERVDGSPYGFFRWDAGNSSFMVDSVGARTIDIMQREPNAIVDMIIVTRDANFDPATDSSWYVPPVTYFQDSDSLGLVVIQAEEFTLNKAGTGTKAGDSWKFASDSVGYLGDGYMESVMLGGGDGDVDNAETINAKLTFNVEFVHTGAHYLWAHVNFPGGSGDSFFFGLDGDVVEQVSGSPFGSYKWDEGNSNFMVDTVGLHTLDIMQREPNAIIDMIIVTRDASFDPVTDSTWFYGPTPPVAQYNVVFVTPTASNDTVAINEIEAYEGGSVFSVTVLEKSVIDSTDLGQLDTADVVVMGRNINSGDVAAATGVWDAIQRPVLAMGMWGLRENRANWVPAGIGVENINGDSLIVNGTIQNTDSVFEGMTGTIPWWNGSHSAFVPDTAQIAAGNGTLMVESDDQRPLFIRWDAFEEYYPGAGHSPNHIRSYLGLGNDDATPINYFGFSSEGATIFFNELMMLAGQGEAIDTTSTAIDGPLDVNIKFYPNPVQGLITLESDVNILSFHLISVSGATIIRKEVNARETMIDMTGLSSGIYVLYVKGEKGVRTFKLKKL